MQLYIWRHNRKFHSWSMLGEPCVHQSMYTDAFVAIAAESAEKALQLLAGSGQGWLPEELQRLTPTVIPLSQPSIAFQEIRCE